MTHRLHDVRDHRHLGWDRRLEPVLEVAPGEEVDVALADCFDGQLDRTASAAEVAGIDLSRANPLTGPIAVAGAEPGDTVVIDLLEVVAGSVGFTVVLEGFGLLADELAGPHVVVSHIEADRIVFGDVAELQPLPMIGTIGLAPAADGPHSVIPPRRVGGNLDCRDVRAGARLRLPVEVDGGVLSLGDAHGAQGDGEVCGTGVETDAEARLRVRLEHGSAPDAPRLQRPRGPRASTVAVAEPGAAAGLTLLTMGVGPDLMAGARDATRAMIDELDGRLGIGALDAYALCSVAGHLRILEVVDAPNWVVGMELTVVDA